MIVWHGNGKLNIPTDTAVTIGKFEGLHRGHRLLIEKAQACRKEGLSSCVFTFDFSGYGSKIHSSILTFDETVEMLEKEYDVDYLIRTPVTEAFFGLSYQEFLRKNLLEGLHMKKIICGDDFCFGHNRLGTPESLKELSEELHYDLEVVPRIRYKDEAISSTRIRKLLSKGEIGEVNACLGYDYSISGTVVQGRRLGRGWGFPTANIVPPEEKYLPRFGVYAARASVDGDHYEGLVNIGVKPTVTDENRPLLEIHLFDFSENLYGRKLKTELLSFIRPEMKFSSKEALALQISEDANAARTFFMNRD